MGSIKTVFVLLALNFVTIYATNDSTVNKTKVVSIASEQANIAPEEHLSKTQAVVVISEKTLSELQNSDTSIKSGDKAKSAESFNSQPNIEIAKKLPASSDNKSNGASVAIKLEATGKPKEAAKQIKEARNQLPAKPLDSSSEKSVFPSEDEVQYQKVLKGIDDDIEGSVRTGFYILMGISIGALLFVGFKINKMRLSRAERKYGVQGNRSNQELAPLPLSMEDPYSDDEDQTLFDVNRQQIRIF